MRNRVIVTAASVIIADVVLTVVSAAARWPGVFAFAGITGTGAVLVLLAAWPSRRRP